MKGSLGGLIRVMNVVLILNEPVFILLFSGSDQLIMKYRTMPRFQQELMGERVMVKVVPEY